MKKINFIVAKSAIIIAAVLLLSTAGSKIAFAATEWGTFNETQNTNSEWYDVSSSYTGQYQAAIVYGGDIYVSSDYGQTWTAVTASTAEHGDEWDNISVSASGKYMIVAAYSDGAFVSSDYGQTWTLENTSGIPGNADVYAVSTGSTGQYMVAGAYGTGLYTSSDYGQTWTASGTTGRGSNNNFESLAISSNGQYIAVGTYEEDMYISSDGGQSWTSEADGGAFDSQELYSTSMSNSGQYIYTVVESGDVYKSSDYGQTWTDISTGLSNTGDMYFVSSSDSGQYVTFAPYEGDDYVSSDFGQTWTDLATSSSAPAYIWPIAISGDGQYITGAIWEGGIYVSSNQALSPVTSVTLNNSPTGAAVAISTPTGTNLTCDYSLTESSLGTQDSGYTYPLGLINFCFDTLNTSDQVSLTFVTNLTPSQVTPRDYNPNTKLWTTIPGAQVTETTLNGQAALRLTYTITDNGTLDSDSTAGLVDDPVGLGLAVTTPSAPDTGYGEPINNSLSNTYLPLLTISGLIMLGVVIRRFTKTNLQ